MSNLFLKTFLAGVLVAGAAGAAPQPPAKTRIQLKDGWYYLNGRKFLINAIGYESGARPGESPYEESARDLAQIRRDLKLIKAAGFNGIRTWSHMSEAELKVVQASGLKLVFGIWLKPDEDFADPAVLAKDLALVRQVLAYSRNYDCVITYLIMNEPMPEHLRKVGAQATRELWTQVRDLIHQLHPGVPVSISGNSAITEWVDMNLFDVYARNAYDYQEGANYTHGYAGAQRAVTDSFKGSKPAILTEFGRSVSRKGSGFYGGNTLQEQADAVVRSYRDILDSGATGLCPFYFADGWWKAGEPAIHNDEPEEWFGFFGYRDGRDAKGTPRPAWHALERYNQALITSPRNQEFYREQVPIEVFCQPGVKRLRVLHQDGLLLEVRPDAQGYCAGNLSFQGEGLKDRELVFESWDGQGRLLKSEVLIVLTGPAPIQWPTVELRTAARDLEATRVVPVEVRVANPGVFTPGAELRYAFSPHKGWDRAETRSKAMDPKLKQQTFADSYPVPDGCAMLALYAGVDFHFGKFVRTIHAQQFLYPGTWADPLRVR